MADVLSNEQNIVPDFSYFTENNVVVTSAGANNLPDVRETTDVATKRTKKKKVAAKEEKKTAIDAYKENIEALQVTVMQYDQLANEFKNDLDFIRASRTMKGKFHYAAEIGQTLNSILNSKVSAIKELNNVARNAQEHDYKVQKDAAIAAQGDDDRRLMDMYNAFIGAPVSSGGRNVLGPSESQMTIIDAVPQYMPDGSAGFQHYMNNLTPEQNMMLFEGNPNVKQVVTYNAATGEKHFTVMDMSTGQEIPNAAHHDDMFLEGVTIDRRRGIARNTNLNESYPLVVYNDDSSTRGY